MPEPSGCGGAASDVASGAGDFRNVRRPHGRAIATSTTPAPTPRIWFVDRLDFFNFDIWLGDETGRASRSSTCRPTSGWKRISDWLVVKLRTAWTVGGQDLSPRTRCSASRCRLSWPATAISRLCSSQDRGGRCKACSGPPASSCCRSSTSCGRCSRSARRRRMAGAARGLQGLPEIGVVDVWRLDRHESESNGDLLANVQDPLTPPSLMLIERVGQPDGAEAGAADLLRRRARGHAARGDFGRRRAHSLCADRARHARPAMRRST